MLKTILSSFGLMLFVIFGSNAQLHYPTFVHSLDNGFKVIVCEKPGNDFVQMETWYHVGSKDDEKGVKGMAHLFEHMMFRGTKKFPGDAFSDKAREIGGKVNAYTSNDMTVYHNFVPVSEMEIFLEMEADRMENFIVSQEILDVEREVVGEEFRSYMNEWYSKLNYERTFNIYPLDHPYGTPVLGNIEEVTKFTADQCMDFFRKHYRPGNSFMIVAGNVKHDDVFDLVDKHYTSISNKKQGQENTEKELPREYKVKNLDMTIDYNLQIYSFVIPVVSVEHEDYVALDMLTSFLFGNDNSILNERLVKKEHLAYGINSNVYPSLYNGRGVIDIFMPERMGNHQVKKVFREEVDKVIENGISDEIIKKFLSSLEADDVLLNYSASGIAQTMGIGELYFGNHKWYFQLNEAYSKVSNEKLKEVAKKYLGAEQVEIINIKNEN